MTTRFQYIDSLNTIHRTDLTITAMSNTLTVEKAESLVRLMTDGLVNIVDKTGEFLLKRESRT